MSDRETILLALEQIRRRLRFSRALHDATTVFGMVAVYRQPDFIQAQTPGTHDVLVLERSAKSIGRSGGIARFGFRLADPLDIDAAVAAVRAAGGTVTEQGEFVPGEPYAFVRDLDGYVVEIWYELPTPVDPPPTPGARRPASPRHSKS